MILAARVSHGCAYMLTHWGRDKWPPFSKLYFQMHFREWKCMNFGWYFTEVCSKGPNWQYPSIGSDNGLAPARWKGIIWTIDEKFTDAYMRRVTARFVTRFNLWLRHDLWPHNASICDPARFVTKSASICDQRYTMILESNLCRGKLVYTYNVYKII